MSLSELIQHNTDTAGSEGVRTRLKISVMC